MPGLIDADVVVIGGAAPGTLATRSNEVRASSRELAVYERWRGGVAEGLVTMNAFDVRIHTIRRKPDRRRPFEVRWHAAGRPARGRLSPEG